MLNHPIANWIHEHYPEIGDVQNDMPNQTIEFIHELASIMGPKISPDDAEVMATILLYSGYALCIHDVDKSR